MLNSISTQRSNREHPDWKHHKPAWLIPTQDWKALQQVIKTSRMSQVPSTELENNSLSRSTLNRRGRITISVFTGGRKYQRPSLSLQNMCDSP